MSGGITNQGEERPSEEPSGTPRRRLDSLPMGARTTGEQALARSRFVRRLRLVLPIFALVLLVVFLFNTKSNDADDAFLDDFKDMSAAADDLKMAKPKFAGIDENGRPFEITAAAAMQVAGSQEEIELEMPRAVQGEGSDITIVTAQKGLYQSKENILELEHDVTLSHNLGSETYVIKVPAATISINEEKVTSNTGVKGIGNDGSTLSADRMTAYNADSRILFEGNVHMRIYQKSAQSDSNNTQNKPETDTDKSEHNQLP